MELVVANLTGKVRSERLDGREYLVAPLSMIVPGVLNGSQGALMYEEADIQATVDAWNGMPILLNHPNGSGRTPKIIEQYGLGSVFGATYNGKLAAEGWFDVEKTRRISPSTLNAIQQGQKVELSTGLKIDFEKKEGIHNTSDGTQIPYKSIARNFRPDHLAILPEGQGACSIKDGCGVNNESDSNLLQRIAKKLGITSKSTEEPKEPIMAKNEITAEQRKVIVDDLITNCSCTYKEEDREALNAMDPLMLAKCQAMMKANAEEKTKNAKVLKDAELVVNAAKKGIKVGETQFVLNEKGEWEQKVEKKEEPVVNKDGKPETKLEDLPANIRNAVAFHEKYEREHKAELIEMLVANIEDKEAQKKQAERLAKRTLEELEADAELLPEPVATTNEDEERGTIRRPSYFGQAVGNSRNSGKKVEIKPLGLPVFNFDDAKITKQKV